MERQRRTQWGIIIISLFFIGLAVDYFFLHILFQQKIKEQQQQQEKKEIEKPVPEKKYGFLPSSGQSHSSVSGENLRLEFQEKAKKCLGSEWAARPTPEALVKDLVRSHPLQRTRLELENTHIRLSDGSIRRLHLIPAENSNTDKTVFELRYFSLDKEGLPLRIPLPPEQSFDPKPEFLSSLKNQGTSFYHETREIQTLQGGVTLSLTRLNNKVYEFRIYQKGRIFSCREYNCLCGPS